MIITLTVTALVVGGILTVFYKSVEPRIEHNRLEEEKKAIFAVLDGASAYDTISKDIALASGKKRTVRIFKGKDANGNIVGYAFVANGPGFAGIISMMVGLNVDKESLAGMKVLDQVETPGLGNKIVENKFTDQFKGLKIKPKIGYVKLKKPEQPTDIQAITGATISSVAVINAINNEVNVVLGILAEEGDGAAAVKAPEGK